MPFPASADGAQLDLMSESQFGGDYREMSMNDEELLRLYAEEASDTAFATLVERHLNLVYSVARRQLSAAALAEDVAQSVFIELAHQARRLKPGTPLVAWLHVVSRRTALNAGRAEARRHRRETTAAEIAAVMKTNPPGWPEIEPLIDEAVETLSVEDRSAILLRFFEQKSLREVGHALGTSEDTAQKRVARALEHLRRFFVQRGIAIGAAGLTTELSAHALSLAPPALSSSISAASALGSGLLNTTATVGGRTLVTATTKKLLAASALVAVVGGGILEASLARRQAVELTALRQDTSEVQAELARWRLAAAEKARRIASDREELAQIAAKRSPADPQLDPEIRAWLARIQRLKALLSERPTQAIPELALLSEQDWFEVTRDADLEREESVRETLANLRTHAKTSFCTRLFDALVRFADANEGSLPADLAQLAPLLGVDFNREMLARYELLHSGKLHEQPAKEWLLAEKLPVDEAYDQRFSVSIVQQNNTPFTEVRPLDWRTALHRFADANSGRLPTEAASLLPYFSTPLSAATVKAFLEKPASNFTPEALGKILRPE